MIEDLPRADAVWAEGVDWLGVICAGAHLAIIVSSLSVGRRLIGRRRGELAGYPGARLATVLAMLTFAGGIFSLAPTLGVRRPEEPAPTAFKAVTALLWVTVAARLPDLVAERTRPRTNMHANAPGPAPTRPSANRRRREADLARLEARTRALAEPVPGEAWLLDRDATLRALRELLADLETEQCKI